MSGQLNWISGPLASRPAARRRLSFGTNLALAVLASTLLGAAPPQEYRPADLGQKPAGARVLPDDFLRGYDPITAYFADDVGPARGPADDGARHLKIAPSWPGAWFWVDKKTLQFRPAEPWPALARFAVDARGSRKVLTTMMSAPSRMSPEAGSDQLRPFRTFTLTFAQALPLASLKSMLKLELRDRPGLADSKREPLARFELQELPRGSHQEAASYAVTLEREIPEGKLLVVQVSLALGDEDRLLWTGRLGTRPAFQLQSVTCGGASVTVPGSGQIPKDLALACGNHGDKPQLVFSAPVKDLTLTALKKLVSLEPAVPDLHFDGYGNRVSLRGKFVPDVLYRMRLGAAPLEDDSGRALRDPGAVELYFHLGWKSPYLRWSQSTALLEANGPRMLPLVGYGDPRADVRIYRVDPLFTGLWPFPENPVVVAEQTAPPFPGEEPANPEQPAGVDYQQLIQHLRLLGSPLVSKVVDLPLGKRGGAARFGLDLGPLLDGAVGKNRPGTYLVGLRRLTGAPERAYVRVQISNLSLTVAEEDAGAVFFVRTLDRAAPVKGAQLAFDVMRETGKDYNARVVPDVVTLTTDAEGRAVYKPDSSLREIRRVVVKSGEDVLVLDPRAPPPQYVAGYWSGSGDWLRLLKGFAGPHAPNDKLLGFLTTERPIYRPGEPVFLNGWMRLRKGGELLKPAPEHRCVIKVDGPDGATRTLEVLQGELGCSAKLEEPNPPTGQYTASLLLHGTSVPVATRTFRIEAYRIPLFEVQISSPAQARLDEPFKAKAVARYYAGGNVAGQPVSWKVTRRPYHWVPSGREGFLFADSTQFARAGASRAPEVITRAETLDESGAAQLEINPALDVDGSPRVYRFEATVTGPDDQQVSATHEVRALPPFLMGVKLTRYLESATEIAPQIIAVGPDGKLLAGQELSVRLYRRLWHNLLRESPFATGQAKYVTEQEDRKLLEKTIKTSADAPVAVTLPIGESGVYVVELHARDKLGRVQTLSADLYVGGPGAVSWPKSREGLFELALDKKSYKPGETARLLVKSPMPAAQALIIVEEPGGNRYAWRSVDGGKAVHEIAVRDVHVPNLPVHVVLMRGRIGEGAAEDGRYRPQTLASSLDLEVEPVRNQVAVGIAHPESARPGAKVDFAITLADEKGKPLAGEVTFWLVDEAVLSLAPEDPLDPLTKMIVRKDRVTSLRDTRNLVVGKLLEQDEEPGGDGAEDEEGRGRKRIVRKNFKSVPFYQATVKVDASGKAVVPVTLSDDLTNFKVRAIAASGFSRFGYKQTVIRVRLPVLVQPQLPRFVRQGDSFKAGGVARLLEGAEGPAQIDLELVGPVDQKGRRDQAGELKANRAQSYLFPVSVQSTLAADPTTLTVRMGVTRRSDGVGDAFEVKLPVLPDRTVERFAYFDRLEPGKLTLKPFPEAPRAGTASQEIVVTSEPGVLELAAALSYLNGYPHGCLEQKLSQMIPRMTLARLLVELGLEDRAGAERVVARRFVEEMSANQDPQGFFGYWPGSKGDIALTALAVEFLQLARKAGVAFDEKLETRAVEALQRTLRSDFSGLSPVWRYNEQTASIRALVRAGRLDEHYLVDLFHHRDKMDLSSVADLANAMSSRRSLFATNLATLETDLWGSVITRLHGGKPVYEGLRWRRSAWGDDYLLTRTGTLAAVLESLVLLSPSDSRLTLLRDGLLASANAELGFGSTYENRRAVAALALYLDQASVEAPPITVELGGEKLSLQGKRKIARATIRSDVAQSGQVKGGEVGARVAYTYLPAAPGHQAPGLAQGFVVSRGYTLYAKADGEAASAAVPQRFDDKKGETRALKVGDVVELHTRLTTEEARHQVALVVPFAAGFEPLNPALANAGSDATPAEADSIAPTYVQRLDHEVRYYFTVLPRGTHSLHLRVRAVTQGSFVHPAPWAEQMYHQEVRGRGEGMRVVVE